MPHVVVTGAAGFLGSTLCEALIARGDSVVGIDRFGTGDHGARTGANVQALVWAPAFDLVRADVVDVDLSELIAGARAVVHLAGRPGVQTSWGDGFRAHLDGNTLTTHAVLEAALACGSRPRVVLASSSSVYGNVAAGRVVETATLSPRSPYGVSKLAAEHLAGVYAARGVPVVTLRYFTLYGPRQRPDMAFHRVVEAAHGGEPFPMRGDGSQVRDTTYVDDAVAATIAALDADVEPGWVGNVGGGEPASLRDAIALVEEITGRAVPVTHVPAAPGDPARTAADLTRTRRALGWAPVTPLRAGLTRQIAWQRRARSSRSAPLPAAAVLTRAASN